MQKQREMEEVSRLRDMEEDIQVKRETTGVKATYAPQHFNRTQSDISGMSNSSHQFFSKPKFEKLNAQDEIARDIDFIL